MQQLQLALSERRTPGRELPVIERLRAVLKRQGIDWHYRASSGSTLLRPHFGPHMGYMPMCGLYSCGFFNFERLAYRKHSLAHVYDWEHEVRIAEAVAERGMLPTTFMLLQPQSWHPDVWTDITRMRTLNGAQSAKGKEMHLCPMQFDIADRAITQYSMPGEEVYDPFAGLGTVPMRAVLLGRRGRGTELAKPYFLDSVGYCEAAVREMSMPSLFDLEPVEGDELEAA